MYKFDIVPEEKKEISKTRVLSRASAQFNVYIGGHLLPFKHASFRDDQMSVYSSSSGQYYQSKIAKNSITFNHEGYLYAASDEDSSILQSRKEILPDLVRGLALEMYPKRHYTDLISGRPVDHQVTVEYSFTDEKVAEYKEECIVPGHILFTSCALIEQPVGVTFGGLTLIYDPKLEILPVGAFGFKSLGKIELRNSTGPVPLSNLCALHGTEVIEGAFRALALEMAKVDQLKQVLGWTAKQVVEIE